MNVANWPDAECDGLRLRVENDRLRGEVEMLKMELAIKDARFERLEPKRRPHYTPAERLEILTLRAMRGWSTEQTARRFQVTAQTVLNWVNGVESGEGSTVAMPVKANRYPDFVRFIVQQFKALCPMLGRHKIADILCRSIAVTERVILTYKDGCTRRILVPISKEDMVEETRLFFEWYNGHRPHMTLGGKTPDEVYFGLHAANAKPRIETRPLAKHGTPCVSPRMCIGGKAGAKVRVRLEFLEGRLHLPIIRVERI